MGAIAKNDGGVVAGSQKVTLSGGGTFVAKNIKGKRSASERKTRTDESGNEDGQWWTSKIPTGTLTLQFPNPTTAAPDEYSTCPIKFSGGVSKTVILFNIGESYEAGGEAMIDCEFAVQLGTTGEGAVAQ